MTPQMERLALKLSAAEDRYEEARKATNPNASKIARLLKKIHDVDEEISKLESAANA